MEGARNQITSKVRQSSCGKCLTCKKDSCGECKYCLKPSSKQRCLKKGKCLNPGPKKLQAGAVQVPYEGQRFQPINFCLPTKGFFPFRFVL